MTPPGSAPSRRTTDQGHISWSLVAKLAIAIIGALLTFAINRFATAFEELKTVVYATQKDSAVIDNRVTTVEHGLAETKDRVKVLESRIMKEK